MSDLLRFEEKVSRCPMSGCHLWTAAVDQRGYGRFGFRPQGEKSYRSVVASRVAWELFVGPVPKGLCVCHHCDNPACVNPDHLFLGTHKDNMDDRDRKGRAIAGQANKTHCPNGHEYAGDNLYVHEGSRKCKACNITRQHDYRLRHGLIKGGQPKITHCKHGHELTEENLYLHGGRKVCKQCTKDRAAAYRQHKKENS